MHGNLLSLGAVHLHPCLHACILHATVDTCTLTMRAQRISKCRCASSCVSAAAAATPSPPAASATTASTAPASPVSAAASSTAPSPPTVAPAVLAVSRGLLKIRSLMSRRSCTARSMEKSRKPTHAMYRQCIKFGKATRKLLLCHC